MATYDLYFDESGNFEEPTLLEDCISLTEAPQKGASQIVGILAQTEFITIVKSEKYSQVSP